MAGICHGTQFTKPVENPSRVSKFWLALTIAITLRWTSELLLKSARPHELAKTVHLDTQCCTNFIYGWPAHL